MIIKINSNKLVLTVTLFLSGTFFKDSHNLHYRRRPEGLSHNSDPSASLFSRCCRRLCRFLPIWDIFHYGILLRLWPHLSSMYHFWHSHKQATPLDLTCFPFLPTYYPGFCRWRLFYSANYPIKYSSLSVTRGSVIHLQKEDLTYPPAKNMSPFPNTTMQWCPSSMGRSMKS